MPDLPDFPKWVPEIVRERARELHAQSLALADEARQKVVAAAEEQQQADAQATAKALTRELQAIAKVVLQQPSNPPTLAQRLLALVALVRQQATGGAKVVREAQEAAARNWQLDADNIMRLAGDPDMQGVWKYLGQRRREGSVKTQRYFHPARDDERDSRGKPAQHWREDRFASRTEWKQAQAFEELFMFVLAMSRHARAATVAEVQHYRAAAKTYREAATREIPGFVEVVDERVWRQIKPARAGREGAAVGRPMKWRCWPTPWKPTRTSNAGRRSLRRLATSWRGCSGSDSTHRRPRSRA